MRKGQSPAQRAAAINNLKKARAKIAGSKKVGRDGIPERGFTYREAAALEGMSHKAFKNKLARESYTPRKKK